MMPDFQNGIQNAPMTQAVLDTTYWRKDGANGPATGDWDLGGFDLYNIDSITANAFIGDGSGLTNLPLSDLQSAFDEGRQIVTNPTFASVQLKQGSGTDTDSVLDFLDSTDTVTAYITGAGGFTGTGVTIGSNTIDGSNFTAGGFMQAASMNSSGFSGGSSDFGSTVNISVYDGTASFASGNFLINSNSITIVSPDGSADLYSEYNGSLGQMQLRASVGFSSSDGNTYFDDSGFHGNGAGLYGVAASELVSDTGFLPTRLGLDTTLVLWRAGGQDGSLANGANGFASGDGLTYFNDTGFITNGFFIGNPAGEFGIYSEDLSQIFFIVQAITNKIYSQYGFTSDGATYAPEFVANGDTVSFGSTTGTNGYVDAYGTFSGIAHKLPLGGGLNLIAGYSALTFDDGNPLFYLDNSANISFQTDIQGLASTWNIYFIDGHFSFDTGLIYSDGFGALTVEYLTVNNTLSIADLSVDTMSANSVNVGGGNLIIDSSGQIDMPTAVINANGIVLSGSTPLDFMKGGGQLDSRNFASISDQQDYGGESTTRTFASYFTGGNSETYRVNVYANINAISAGTLTLTIVFEYGATSKTLTFYPAGVTTAGQTTTGFKGFVPVVFRADPGTNITISATFVGASIDYDVGSAIEIINKTAVS